MIVLDTCVAVWLALDPSSLSKTAAEAIAAAEEQGGAAIAGVTLYELAWSIGHERIAVAIPVKAFLARVEERFQVLPVNGAIARLAVDLPGSYPSDPTDRMIGAPALAHRVPLVTPDKVIRMSKTVTVVW